VADYFVWDRDQGVPVAKQMRCPACAWDGRTAIDAEDRARLAEVPAQGMHYHYLLDRVAALAPGGRMRTRLEQMLELYTPRNLYALVELGLKIERTASEMPVRRALQVLLLDCLDRCSLLSPLPGSKARRRGLMRPGRFLERNVWSAFEEAADRLQALARNPVSGWVDTLAAFEAEASNSALSEGLIRDLPANLPPRSLRLILTSPPALDSAVWSLSYLWAAWLLGAEAAAPLLPLLRQRTPDPAWYARVMAGSLRTLGGLLRDDGRLVLVLTNQRPAVVEALVLAASSARLGLAALVQRGSDYRLELTPTFVPRASLPDAPLAEQVEQAARSAAFDTVRACGEPVAWRRLQAAIWGHLAESGLLRRALQSEGVVPSALDWISDRIHQALDGPGLVRLEEERWWAPDLEGLATPLCDRVEEAAFEILHDALALTEKDFGQALYARFPGMLTPEAELAAACLRAYGRAPTPGYWQLRKEDLPVAREREQQAMIDHLLALGRRLGYETGPGGAFDVAWLAGGKARAVFLVRHRAAVDEALDLSQQAAGARPYLVIPGGRAVLVSQKLARNPLWQQAVDETGWRFIKYRHVRQLAAQPEVDEYALRTIVGLDPIVEREQAQIPLF
jgi:hypothetical protein